MTLLSLLTLSAQGSPSRADDLVNSREAVAPVAPILPDAIVAAIQESRSQAAIEGLDGLIKDRARRGDDRAFLAWIKGIILTRAGRHDAAAGALRAALGDAPG